MNALIREIPILCSLALFFSSGAVFGQASLRFSTPQGEVVASGFVVSTEGYVATSFHAAQNATAGKLIGERNRTFDIAGWVAADKRHGVVLLALKNPPQDIRVAPFDEVGPAAGAEVMPLPGPLSQPLRQQWLAAAPNDLVPPPPGVGIGGVRAVPAAVPQPIEPPKLIVRRRLVGAELFPGLSRDADDACQAPNTELLVLNFGLELSYAGAPLWTAERRVCGMISGITDGERRLRIVIDLRHVQALIPSEKVAAKPLSQLKKFEDAETAIDDPNATAATVYHLPLAERFAAYTARLTECERSAAEARKAIAASKGVMLEVRAKLDQLETTLREMVPEETFVDIEQRTITERGRDGGTTTRVVQERVTRRRLSARQLAQVSELTKERAPLVTQLYQEWFTWHHADRFEAPVAERVLQRARRELIYLADPFELRSEAEHRAFVERLDEVIGEGGAPGMFYLARGLAKLRLRKSAEASADWKEAEDIDGGLQPLVSAAEGRRLILDGEVSKGVAKFSRAEKAAPNDAAIQFLRARGELDRKAYTQVARSLQEALDQGAEPAETHAALGWLYATTSAGDASNARRAIAHAKQACIATEDNDWLCLAGLGAAYARSGDFDRAQAAFERARLLAPLEAHEQCDAWQECVVAKKAIEREWR